MDADTDRVIYSFLYRNELAVLESYVRLELIFAAVLDTEKS